MPKKPQIPPTHAELLAMPISAWLDWWVWIECGCRHSRVNSILKISLDRVGSRNTTLGDIAARLVCSRCHERPRTIELRSNAGLVYMPDPERVKLFPAP